MYMYIVYNVNQRMSKMGGCLLGTLPYYSTSHHNMVIRCKMKGCSLYEIAVSIRTILILVYSLLLAVCCLLLTDIIATALTFGKPTLSSDLSQ